MIGGLIISLRCHHLTKRLTIKMRLLFFMPACLLLMSSCSSKHILRLYPEPPLKSSDTARLHLFAGEGRYSASTECMLHLSINEFDGKTPDESYKTLEFLPGAHTVTVDFQPFMSGGIREIHFDAQAGGDYIFGCGMDYTLGEWTAEVLDRVTGEKVSSTNKRIK